MNAEDKIGRAWLIVALAGILAGLTSVALVVWIFWKIAGYAL